MSDYQDSEYSDNDYDEGYYSDCVIDKGAYVKEFFKQNQSCINYSILDLKDIKVREEEAISRVCSVLSLSRSSATFLLLHYNWEVETVNEAWFSEEEKIRKKVGLLEKPVVEFPNEDCGICFEKFGDGGMHSASCGHQFCRDCWDGYITASIHDGAGCLSLKCPEPKCRAAIDEEMMNELVSNKIDRGRYLNYRVCNYVETNPNIKWCPAPDCEYCVEFELENDSDTNYDVTCKCTHSFCWKCAEDAHRPVDCSTVAKWILKNNDEPENMYWILAHTKACPKCQTPIEKNAGCMIMKCRAPCSHEFCWLCLKPDWFHVCNRYKEKVHDTRDKAKKLSDKYLHYFERWAANKKSREQANSDFLNLRDSGIKEFSARLGKEEYECQFLLEAWLQVVSCRRILEWSYAYGYYLPESDKMKKELFEFLQGEAEKYLESLHYFTEKESLHYFTEKGLKDDRQFLNFQFELKRRTLDTRNYFFKLVKALENGLEDLDAGKWCCEACTFLNYRSVYVCEVCETPYPYQD